MSDNSLRGEGGSGVNDKHYEGHAARPYACHDTTELDYHLRGQSYALWAAGLFGSLALAVAACGAVA